MDDFQIPSANIDGIDVKAIARNSPNDADEIRSLGALLDVGAETDKDLVRLCELLFKHGEIDASERLLRCNAVVEGGAIRETYKRLFGSVSEAELQTAIDGFARQFGVTLLLIDASEFLKKEYSTRPISVSGHGDPAIVKFLDHPCLVAFAYDPKGSVADIACDTPELYNDYLLLRYTGGEWKQSPNTSDGR